MVERLRALERSQDEEEGGGGKQKGFASFGKNDSGCHNECFSQQAVQLTNKVGGPRGPRSQTHNVWKRSR